MDLVASPGHRRARPRVSPPPATSCTWSAASVRDALLGRLGGDDLDFTTTPGPSSARPARGLGRRRSGTTGIEFGTVGARRHGLRLEITTFRADAYDRRQPQPRRHLRRQPRRRPACAATSRSTRWPCRLPGHAFVDPYGGLDDLAGRVLRHARRPRRSRSPTTRCGCCARPGSPPSSASTSRREVRRGDDGDGRASSTRITAERVRDELVKLMLGRRPAPGCGCWSTPGWPTRVLPELPALRLEIDEHHQHKDVYEHTLTVLEQAIALETDGPGPGAAAGRAAARHRQAGDPAVRGRRRRQLPPPRGRRRQADRASGCGAAVPQGRRSTTSPSWSCCTCASTATARGDGPTPRCAATSPTPAAAGPAARADPLRLHHPQPAQGAALRAATTTLEERIARLARAGGARRDPPGPRRQRDHGGARGPAGPVVGQACQHLLELRMERGPLGARGRGGRAAAVGRGERRSGRRHGLGVTSRRRAW